MQLYKVSELKYINLDHITIIRNDNHSVNYIVNFIGKDYTKICERQFFELMKYLNKQKEELELPNYPI